MAQEWNWLYGDWRDYSDLTQRLSRLASHIQEMEAIKPAISSSGATMSASYEGLDSRIARHQAYWEELDAKVRRLNGAGSRLNLRLNRRR